MKLRFFFILFLLLVFVALLDASVMPVLWPFSARPQLLFILLLLLGYISEHSLALFAAFAGGILAAFLSFSPLGLLSLCFLGLVELLAVLKRIIGNNILSVAASALAASLIFRVLFSAEPWWGAILDASLTVASYPLARSFFKFFSPKKELEVGV